MVSSWKVAGVSNPREQALMYHGVNIPIELQNKSVTVRGAIRVISEQREVLGSFQIRAIDAVVDHTLLNNLLWLVF